MPFSTRPRTSWTPPNMSSSREEDPRAHDGAADNSPSRAAGATDPYSFVGSVPHAKLRRTDLGAVATAGWSASCRPNSGGGIRQFLSPPQERCRADARCSPASCRVRWLGCVRRRRGYPCRRWDPWPVLNQCRPRRAAIGAGCLTSASTSSPVCMCPPARLLRCALNQGSAGSSPPHISGTIEAIVASTSQFPAGVYQNRLGYQNSSAAVGCSAPRSRIFVGISIVVTLPKSLAHKRITRW